MRVTFNLSSNYRQLVPYNYQQQLVGCIHKWLGPNAHHDEISLYSLSWLGYNGIAKKGGLFFPNGTSFHLSAARDDLLADVIEGLQQDTELNWGMRVTSIMPQRTPEFSDRAYFRMQSPVFLKRRDADGKVEFLYYDNPEADSRMTEIMRHKMAAAGVEGAISLKFDRAYEKTNIKLVTYRGIKNKASMCPVIAEGDPHCIGFCWNVGIGNSTGIGFGAVK